MNDLESNSNKGNTNNAGNDNSKQLLTNTSGENDKITNPDNNKTDNKQKINWPSWIQAISSICLIGITGFYTYYASQQVEQMRNTVKEMGKQSGSMHDATNANKKAVQLSEGNIKATQDQFRRDQRAWIGIANPIIDRGVLLKEGEYSRFEIIVTNSGKTPAKNIESWITDKELPVGKKLVFKKPISIIGIQSKTVLLPNAKIRFAINTDRRITKEDIERIKSGKSFLYVYGKITYQDVFGKEHYTTFCEVLEPDLIDMADCGQYNDAN